MQKNTTGISPEVFDTLLSLSKLEMEQTERTVLSGQIGKLVNYFEILKEFKDGSGDSSPYSCHDETDLRDDTVRETLTQQDLKKMTDEYMDGYFRTPKVLGSGA